MTARCHLAVLQACLATLGAAWAGPAAAVSLGQTDTFQNASLDGWASGPRSPNPPIQVPNGGPAGAGDGFLLLSSSGNPGAGGRLVAFGGPQWTGNYLSAGVTTITLDAHNLGPNALNLRLYLEGPGGTSFSLAAQATAASGPWQHLVFDLHPAALSGAAAVAVLANVTLLRLYHSPAAAGPQASPFLAASLGIDNVSAVPEPAHAWLLAGGLAAAILLLQRRRRAG